MGVLSVDRGGWVIGLISSCVDGAGLCVLVV